MVTSLRLHRFALMAVLVFSISACATISSHQNFKNTMEIQVGRNIDNPYYFRNRSPSSYISTKILANGNVEEGFKCCRRHYCRVYFEIDKSENRVIGWRYEGGEENCVIVP